MNLDPAALSLDLLPESVRELIGVIGLDAALLVVRHAGGVRITISPSMGAKDHWLVALIGRDQCQALGRHYGRCILAVPRCQAALLEVRDRQMRALYDARQATVSELALRYQLTEKQIYVILGRGDRTVAGQRREPGWPMQPSLFG